MAKANNRWKTIAILLAVALGLVLIGAGLIVSGAMKLGLSIL
jgi:hypothetical protein